MDKRFSKRWRSHLRMAKLFDRSQQAVTEGDELVVARCDMDLGKSYKASTFNFARHREPQAYGLIVERKGAVGPA